ncbi:vesicle transport through interaction with t-SNAREs 1 [Fistulifera solaris]|uniref:Vesicle transport through interaction with t-SNAREs 1 n=1 Tax=Fistulifera solaris TaxID=1519565 RepID=A0A1Z5KPD8_FISSO|nr:vesicle transport through interaction with t-SNAREs 1 [Fistulifera solaris]|eukprot:GAX28180.1 vesicle transport through interaction with t-SNAREs 1 [Fistulifera solaris]
MADSDTTFQRYDDEFQSLLQQIENSLSTEPPGAFTKNLLQQCDDLIKQMALEARSQPSTNVKNLLLQKVRQAKSQYQAVQQKSDKQSLLGGTKNSNGDYERRVLQKNEDMLSNQNDTLERARRTMQETEAVALEITEELGNNRETLLNAHGRVREVSGMTGRARRILTSMSRRQVQQKMIVYGIAIGLVLAFLFLLWAMWR